ncbi:hypothetical protein M0802_010481 [Mischocyttarus mexicanus]|nr:hypothetical protein M0802_010481 [Mischocyttarus mexicanus]
MSESRSLVLRRYFDISQYELAVLNEEKSFWSPRRSFAWYQLAVLSALYTGRPSEVATRDLTQIGKADADAVTAPAVSAAATFAGVVAFAIAFAGVRCCCCCCCCCCCYWVLLPSLLKEVVLVGCLH